LIKKPISDWCATNRPKKYSDYKEIISAVSNKIRLEARFEKQLNEFLTKYAADVNSFKDTSPASLFDAISKQMQYFELTNSEKITSELKGLLV
jgi:hypothetical protein